MWLRLSVTYREPHLPTLKSKIPASQFAELCVLWDAEPWLPFWALVKFATTLFPDLKGKSGAQTIEGVQDEIDAWKEAARKCDAGKNNSIHQR